MDSPEKLSRAAGLALPMLEQVMGEEGGVLAMLSAFLAPQLDEWVNVVEEADPGRVDAIIALAIDFLGRLRSDTAAPIICRPDGTTYATVTYGGAWHVAGAVAADAHLAGQLGGVVTSVLGPDLRDGPDGDREEPSGEGAGGPDPGAAADR